MSKAIVTEISDPSQLDIAATEIRKGDKSEPVFGDGTGIAKKPGSESLPTIKITGKPELSEHDGPWEGIAIEQAANVTADPVNPEFALKTRAFRSRGDRILLSKIFAVLLCVVALINILPAINIWLEWVRFDQPVALSRWMYLQIFVAAIHLIYAVFLVQIPDWSALRTVAVAMLAVAFVFGIVSTGMLVGKGHGAIASFLEIPFSMATRASIWCVAMLCLSTLISYMSGREAANWRRTEQLLREIYLSKSELGANP